MRFLISALFDYCAFLLLRFLKKRSLLRVSGAQKVEKAKDKLAPFRKRRYASERSEPELSMENTDFDAGAPSWVGFQKVDPETAHFPGHWAPHSGWGGVNGPGWEFRRRGGGLGAHTLARY